MAPAEVPARQTRETQGGSLYLAGFVVMRMRENIYVPSSDPRGSEAPTSRTATSLRIRAATYAANSARSFTHSKRQYHVRDRVSTFERRLCRRRTLAPASCTIRKANGRFYVAVSACRSTAVRCRQELQVRGVWSWAWRAGRSVFSREKIREWLARCHRTCLRKRDTFLQARSETRYPHV